MLHRLFHKQNVIILLCRKNYTNVNALFAKQNATPYARTFLYNARVNHLLIGSIR
jgi:hypothetical protein